MPLPLSSLPVPIGSGAVFDIEDTSQSLRVKLAVIHKVSYLFTSICFYHADKVIRTYPDATQPVHNEHVINASTILSIHT